MIEVAGAVDCACANVLAVKPTRAVRQRAIAALRMGKVDFDFMGIGYSFILAGGGMTPKPKNAGKQTDRPTRVRPDEYGGLMRPQEGVGRAHAWILRVMTVTMMRHRCHTRLL